MSVPEILFACAYQLPALLMGMLLRFLIPSPPLRAVFVLPGTLVHELLHLVVGLVLNGKPLSLSLWPRHLGNGQWVMGSVSFANIRWYNGLWIGLAPLLALVGAVLLAPPFAGWTLQTSDLRYWALATPILAMCLPSGADVRLTLASWPLLAAPVGWAVWYLR